MKQRYLSFLLVTVMLFALAGCGKTAAPEGITLYLDGEPVSEVDLLNGTELSGLTAEIAPADYPGEAEWASEDAGIVKPAVGADGVCTLTAKKTGSTKVTVSCGGVTASLRVHVLRDQEHLSALETAATVNGVAYSPEKCRIYLGEKFYSFVDMYGEAAIYYGIDVTGGIRGLKSQSCDQSEDGTWYGYFLSQALDNLCQVQALCDLAREEGYSLTEEDGNTISERMELLETEAENQGFASADDFLAEYYGKDVTMVLYREFLENAALADKAYQTFLSGLSYSEEELASHYAGMDNTEGDNDYYQGNMRHVLIMAEADENGNISEAAVAAAHEKAEELYARWLEGDRTEESFAEMANEYSDDTGSNTTGGLYEDITQGQMVEGIDSWIFAAGRKAGDTTVVDNAGNYTGTHIVLFTGYDDEKYCSKLAREDLEDVAVSEWLNGLIADYRLEFGKACDEIGDF